MSAFALKLYDNADPTRAAKTMKAAAGARRAARRGRNAETGTRAYVAGF